MTTAVEGRVGRRISPIRSALVYLAALLVFFWVAFPVLWLVKSSISPETDLLSSPPTWWPSHPTLGFYRGLWGDAPGVDPGTGQQRLIPRGLLNSFTIAAIVAAVNLAVGAPAAYVIARYRFRFRMTILNAMLATRMVPSLVLLVPFYLIFWRASMIDTISAVALAHISVTLPFTIWILRGHFDNVPLEIEKAARVDGCTKWQAFARVALPLAAPGLVVAGLFAFMISWNEFPLALVLTQSSRSMTVQAALAGLVSYQGVSYGFLFAGSVLAALPPVLIALVLQRHLSGGLLEGSVK
jgi:multiple sugar transport system permease protein